MMPSGTVIQTIRLLSATLAGWPTVRPLEAAAAGPSGCLRNRRHPVACEATADAQSS